MAFLQTKHNLWDLDNPCLARKALGLNDLAQASSSNVHITGGTLKLDVENVQLRPPHGIEDNAILVLGDQKGTLQWQPYP